MITVTNLSKYYGGQTLFEDVNLQLTPGNRYGIVGANGSGKSTLLKIMAGEEEPSGGAVQMPKRARVGVLKQDQFKYEDTPIIDVVMMGIPELWQAMREKEELLANAHEHFDADRYAELEDIVLQYDGYSMEARAAEILEGLNILTAVHRQPLSILSGGFKLRVLLARTLASSPDVLLLDEPTNHLDIVSIGWLEKFLQSFPGCAAVVSHDHLFLNRVCTHIIDVDYQRVTLYAGNYEAFEEGKHADRERIEAEIDKREQQIADHKAFIERFKAKATKARQAQSRAKMIDRIVIERLPESSRRYPTFKLSARRPSGKSVLELEGIKKAYGNKQVLHGVSLRVSRGDRLAIIGPNGIGKSTLLKIAVGQLSADAGKVAWGHETYVGYFAQDHKEVTTGSDTTLQSWLWNYCADKPMGYVRGKLAEVLFTKEEVDKKVENLSGGEAARMVFAKLSIEEPNVLVLDEPTNHLDLEGIEALAVGLESYDGTVIFVSHDRWFVSRLATRIVEIRADGVEDYPGTYEEYLASQGEDHLDIDAVRARAQKDRAEAKKKRKGA